MGSAVHLECVGLGEDPRERDREHDVNYCVRVSVEIESDRHLTARGDVTAAARSEMRESSV